MFIIITNDIGPARTKGTRRGIYAGRDTIVAPITMIVPGVLAGSAGPIFYPPEVVANTAPRWEGIPILVNHPVRDGKPVTTDEQVIAAFGIGTVRNPLIANGMLEALGWFDVLNTQRVEPRILQALLAGTPLELSVGIQALHVRSDGVHNGRRYHSVLMDLQPDHLAILPDMEGACSLADGCGVHSTPNVPSQETAMFNCKCGNPPLVFTPMYPTAPVTNGQAVTAEAVANAKAEGQTIDPLLGRAVPELNFRRRMGYE